MHRLATVTLLALAADVGATFKDKEVLDVGDTPAPKVDMDTPSIQPDKNSVAFESFQSLGGDLGHLRQQMDALREQKAIELNLQRAKYQHLIMAQEHENSGIYAQSLNIMGTIEAHQHKLQNMRRSALDIEQDSIQLRQDMLSLSENVSAARDFITEALRQPDGSDDPAVQVLAEVTAKKDELKRVRSKEKRIREIDEAGASSSLASSNRGHQDSTPTLAAALLQLSAHTASTRPHSLVVNAAAQVHPDDALEVMHSLKHSISDMLSHHNATLNEMEASYNQTFDRNDHTRRSLLAKQQTLNSTEESLASLEPRLVAAVEFEMSTRSYLHSRLNALRSYIGLLSRWPEDMQEERMLAMHFRTLQLASARAAQAAVQTPEAEAEAYRGVLAAADAATVLATEEDGAGNIPTSAQEMIDTLPALLQTESVISSRPGARHEQPPLINDEATEAFAEVDMRLAKINQDFSSMDRAQHDVQEQKTVSYTAELLGKNTDSLKQAKANARLASSMMALKANNHKLLTQARQLQKEIGLLRTDMTSLQLNLSIAVEFAHETMRSSNFTAAPELAVIRMLADRDDVRKEKEEHQSRLEEVSSGFSKLALEIESNGDAGVAPQDLSHVGDEELAAIGLLQTGKGELHRKSARRELDELLELRRHRQATTSLPPKGDDEVVASIDALEARILGFAADWRKAEEGFDEQYRERLNKSADRQAMLAKEGEGLEMSKKSMETFRDRLMLAVTRLHDIHKDMLSRSLQVRTFLRSLGVGARQVLRQQQPMS